MLCDVADEGPVTSIAIATEPSTGLRPLHARVLLDALEADPYAMQAVQTDPGAELEVPHLPVGLGIEGVTASVCLGTWALRARVGVEQREDQEGHLHLPEDRLVHQPQHPLSACACAAHLAPT